MSRVINVTDVRINELNFYPSSDEMVSSLASHIARDGQLENATVYEDESPEDGRTYTLIGGETRFRAICKLVEDGLSNGDFRVEVIPKPESKEEEMRLITADNCQRSKSSSMRYHEILKLEEIYRTLDPRPEGKKRDWVGKMLGISGRMVDNIKSKYAVADDEAQQATSTTGGNMRRMQTRASTASDAKKELRKAKKALERFAEICEELGTYEDIEERYRRALNNISSLTESA